MKILHFPLARITICFILGIIFYPMLQPAIELTAVGVALALLLLLALHRLLKAQRLTVSFGLLTVFAAFGTGMATASLHDDSRSPNHYTNYMKADHDQNLTLVVHEKLKNTAKNARYVSHITQINGVNSFGKVILNIRLSNHHRSFPIGSRIILNGGIEPNKGPFNPNQFDYAAYLEKQQIYGQVYTNAQLIRMGQPDQNLWSVFSNFRDKIIRNLELSHFKEEELNILIALLLGQQQDISKEVLANYQLAGAVHIFSVSGLHVGFILLFVTFLLKPLPNTKRNNLLKLTIILLSLWSYGALAGMAPSVVRSVTMFSFVAVGNHLRRTVNSFHTLLVSMLLILLWKPSFLFDVGFQLSYLALFFILWLQPVLSGYWQPKNKALQYLRDIVSVSLAAQLGTLPLSIYYFHQFPGLFLLTNIIVLPLLGIIMALGLLAIVIACFGTVPQLFVQPLEILISMQNAAIEWVASFENLVFRDISFTDWMLWVSYWVLICFCLWVTKHSARALALALLGVLSLQLILIAAKFDTFRHRELVVFHLRKATMITARQAGAVTVFSNDSMLGTLDRNIPIQSYLVANFCEIKQKSALRNLLYFNGKKILIIDRTAVYCKEIKPDILILRNSPKLNLARLLQMWKPAQIVVDGSNYKSYVRLWESTCRQEKIPFHFTGEKGFYKI